MEKSIPKKTIQLPHSWAITALCTLCGNCIQVCPTKSIFVAKNQYIIDSDTCDGTALCSKVCPVDAIRQLTAEKT